MEIRTGMGLYTKSVNSEQSTTGVAAGATGRLNAKTALSLGCKGEVYGRNVGTDTGK